ncbi:MAG: serine protease, partial [Bacteroidota bacterium]
MKGSIVHILGGREDDESFEIGMGFFITKKHILTCAHNLLSHLEDESYRSLVKIRILEDKYLYASTLLRSCFSPKEQGDFALLEVIDPPIDVLPFQLRSFLELKNTKVSLIGKPNDLQEFQQREGVAGNLESHTGKLDYKFLQLHEIKLYPGFSGAPVVISGTNIVIGMYQGKHGNNEHYYHALSSHTLIHEISSAGLSYPNYFHFDPVSILNAEERGYNDWKLFKSTEQGTFTEGIYPSMYVGLNRHRFIEFIFGDLVKVWKMLMHTEQIILEAQFRNFFEDEKAINTLRKKLWFFIEEEDIKEVVRRKFSVFFKKQSESHQWVNKSLLTPLLNVLDEYAINGVFDPENNLNCHLGICVHLKRHVTKERWDEIQYQIAHDEFLNQFSFVFCSTDMHNINLVSKSSMLSQFSHESSKFKDIKSWYSPKVKNDHAMEENRANLLRYLDEDEIVSISYFLIIVKKEKIERNDEILIRNYPNLVWVFNHLSNERRRSLSTTPLPYHGQKVQDTAGVLFRLVKRLRMVQNPNIQLIHFIKKELLATELPYLIFYYFPDYMSELVIAYFLFDQEQEDSDPLRIGNEDNTNSHSEDAKEVIQSLLIFALQNKDFKSLENWIAQALTYERLIDFWPLGSQRQLKEELLLTLIKYSNRQKDELSPQILELLNDEFYENFGNSENDSLRHQAIYQLRKYVIHYRGNIPETRKWLTNFFEKFIDFRFLIVEVEVPLKNIFLLAENI